MGFDTQGHTSGRDVVIFDGSTLTDRLFSNSHSLPSLDAQQDWILIGNTTNLGDRTIEYTRARDTGDSSDYVFSSTPGSLEVVGSRGNGFTLNHHANRNATTVSFSLLGIDDSDQISFSMAPNPASSRLRVALPSTMNNGSIEIYDMLSRKIFTTEMMNTHTSIIDVSSWNSGIYLVKVSNGASSQTKRFVKQ